MSYIEVIGSGSRAFNITTDNITQTFTYRICPDHLLEDDAGTYNAFFDPNDDVAVAKFAYATFPAFRTFPISSSDNIALYLIGISGSADDGESWLLTLTYGIPPLDQADGGSGLYVQFGFDTGGDSIHINKSLEVVDADVPSGSGATAPTIYGLIGVSADGSIEGTDIIGRALKMNITGYYTADLWSSSVMSLFASLTGRYNNATFYGFSAGEVLLVGVSAQGEQYKMIPVTFNFDIKPNVSGLSDPPFPTLTKLGHHVVDYHREEGVLGTIPVQVPYLRYVHRVYEPGNFALLGI